MLLLPGTRLGPYEILAPLGAGGMGEVYRARDTRLGREVAVKVLPEALAKNPDRLARFEREARAASTVTHPHIVSVFDVGRESDVPYLVTELVEGSDLRTLLQAGRLPLERSLELAAQIAEGLAEAHEKGIVHRDLKPDNILVTASGLAKIADFGLAQAEEHAIAGSATNGPTVSALTEPGTVMGTVGYMSPEQIRGERVDYRSDIFSFGSLLHEMLTGERAFQRATAAETMTAILHEEPPSRSDPKSKISPTLDRILRRCLEKRPEARFQSARDLAFALRLLASAEEPIRSRSTPARPGITRSIVPLPAQTRLAGRSSPALAISRDGAKMAFVAQAADRPPHLYIYRLDRGETQEIPESEYAEGPFFSPDGAWVAFAADIAAESPRAPELRKYSFSSGLTQTVCPLSGYEGGSWGENGEIFFIGSAVEGLRRVPFAGGRDLPMVTRFLAGEVEGARCIGYPRLSADGRSAIVIDWDASALGDTSLLDLSSGKLRTLAKSGSAGVVVRTGHLIYTKTDGTLFAAPFDSSLGGVTGPAVAVLKDLALDAAGGVFAVSETGTLVFAQGQLRGSDHEWMRLVRLKRDGEAQPLSFPAEAIGVAPRLSPDGRNLAVSSRFTGIWIYDVRRGTRARLPSGTARLVHYPIWTRDGERIVFRGARIGEMGWKLFWQRADGGDEPQILSGDDPVEKRPRNVTPDGETLLYEVGGSEVERGLWGLSLVEKKPPERLVAGVLEESTLSPDGRFLAFQSGESGSVEVFIQGFPGRGRRVQVSVGGGRSPRWSPDGRELFYRSGNRFFTVSFGAAGNEPELGSPELLFEHADVEGYDVEPDGFLAIKRLADSGIVQQLHLVTGWFAELERLAPLRLSSGPNVL